jgi:MinD superfamily P-loop ATPase
MPSNTETLLVHVNVEIAAEALATIVETAKQQAGRNEKGHYTVDTAAAVGDAISRFLQEKDFTNYVKEGSG